MTTLGVTCPYYGGGQVRNPANIQTTSGAPSSNIKVPLGYIAVDNAAQLAYMVVSHTGGVTTWASIAAAAGTITTINSLAPVAGDIIIAGTASEITASNAGHTVTLSIPAAFVAPGSVASTTTMTAGTGFSATAGSVVAAAGEVRAGGDIGGATGKTSLSNANSQVISTGVGSVKMSTANPATNTAWIKIYIDTTAYWIPAWTTNAP